MNKNDLMELFEYNQWAKRKLLGSLEQVKPEDFVKDLHSSHGGIHGTLLHIVNAENIWVGRLDGQQPVVPLDGSQFKNIDDFKRVWDELDNKLSRLIGVSTDEQLRSRMEYQDSKGNKFFQPRIWAFSQLFNHFTYHRGQIVTLQRQLGYKPVGTDLIGFYREKKS